MTSLLAVAVWLSARAAGAELLPPSAPRRKDLQLDSASEVALDASQTLFFLERGQEYFEAYPKEKRTDEENRAYLKFLEDYERELDTFKGEMEILRLWTEKKSALAPTP